MLSKFSVKKPYFIFVAVVIVLILGVVSVLTMKTDLLPEMEVPYLAVITTDIGASPEQVEEEVTDPMEESVGSVSGVANVYSTSAENFSMIFLEFEDNTDMDSALVKVSAAANEATTSLPDSAGTPTFMEISMDMVASMYLGVYADDMDIATLTQKVEDVVEPALERQDGVASVSASGDVTDSIEIVLNQDKIDNVNDGILGEVNDQLADAKAELEAAERELDRAEEKIDEQQEALDETKETTAEELATASEATSQALAVKSVYAAAMSAIEASMSVADDPVSKAALQTSLAEMQTGYDAIDEQLGDAYTQAEAAQTTAILTLAEAQSQLDQAETQIASSRETLEEGWDAYEEQRDEARSAANVDALIDAETLASLITAQNFEMPAGYVDSQDGDTQWVVKVGEEYTSKKQLKNMVLTDVDGIGEITLGDVADVVSMDDADDSYAKMNGQDAILLSITKQSTANTSEVCEAVNEEIAELEESNDDVHITAIMDQSEYISLYINTILTSLVAGAILAVVVLVFFLKRVKPTLVVAFSIPFSVLFALVLMYFCGLTLNVLTLGALSLSIGMLVDNSIVVMENIYRLKERGYSATRAAAQGAVQVSGAVIASTVTTICVFLPFVFAEGTVRELMVPFALTISFALLASLLVALTVVPALGSKIFKNEQPAQVKWFEKVKNGYGKALDVVLDHKAPVLVVAVALLGVAIYIVVQMGVVMLPEMTSNQISAEMIVDTDVYTQEESYEIADTVGERVADLDGIEEVGIADSNTTSGTMSNLSGVSGNLYTGAFVIYATVDEDKISTEEAALELEEEVMDCCSDIEDITVATTNNMDSLTSLASSDLTVDVSGSDYEEVLALSDDVCEVVESVEGYDEVENGQEDADPTLHVDVDKDEVAAMGTTVAQVYAEISEQLTDSTTAISITSEGKSIDVNVDTDEINDYTRANLLDMTFEDGEGEEHKLSEVATVSEEEGVESVSSENGVYTLSVSAEVEDGYNISLLGRELEPKLAEMDVPDDYTVEISGTNETIDDMLEQMSKLMLLGFILLYLVMVAQFQSFLSPFIIIFTVPLAFTGGLFALVIGGEQLSMMALLGFVILMGTVVNNGIVFVDYVNKMRLGGMSKRAALIVTGKARMRPIIMTALTTIISMCALIFNQQIGASMERGMALVVAGGLLYATFMTLFVVPILYDLFNRKPMKPIDVGEDVESEADDAQAYIAEMGEDARETYDYESRRQRRKRVKAEKKAGDSGKGKHSELDKVDEPVSLEPAPDDPDGGASGGTGGKK